MCIHNSPKGTCSNTEEYIGYEMNMSDGDPQYVSPLIKTLLNWRGRYFGQRRLRDANNLSDRIGTIMARNRSSELAESSSGTSKWWQKVKDIVNLSNTREGETRRVE